MTALQDFARLSGKIYIDGRFETSRTTQFLDVIDPATEERAGGIADTTDGEVDHAIELANSARRVWMGMDSRSRAVILHDIAALLRRDKAPYAECLTREEGKPYKESVDEVSWCATAIDYYAELARHETGRLAGATVPGQFHFSVKEPLGTIVIVLPFNYPLVLLCWEAAAALAAGNAVIVKPHEQTSLTTLKFMEVFATLPPGLMQVRPTTDLELGYAWRRLHRIGRGGAGGGAYLCRDVQALSDRSLGQRSLHCYAFGSA
jgi:acyl-CoA reductase-like NAD-dependent aldehyde dehydrogenase